MTLLHVGDPDRARVWNGMMPDLMPDVPFRIWPDLGDPAEIRYLAALTLPPGLIASLPRLEVLFSIGAGIDQLDLSLVPRDLALVRMIEPALTLEMAEYATFATLALHRHMLGYIANQRLREWKPRRATPADRRRIGVMGIGVMGQAVLDRLDAFGFPLSGWSRSTHGIEGVATYAGEAGLDEFLAACDILICLLPLTDATRGILNRALFARLPEGAAIINMARGGHLVEADLLDALASGHLSGAVLDVAQEEPLPRAHPFWDHPRILITPHIAGKTDHEGSARAVAANIARHREGLPMEGLVRCEDGY